MPLQLQGQSLLLPTGQQSPLRHQKWQKGHIPLRCRQNGGHDCGRVEVDAVHARRDVLLSATALVLSPWAASVRAADDMQKMHVPIDELKDIIADDFQNGQYYITGHLTTGVFASDCSFKDPTTNVKVGRTLEQHAHHPAAIQDTCTMCHVRQGPDVYSRAVALLFDQSTSRADLIDIEVHCLLTEGPMHAWLRIRSEQH